MLQQHFYYCSADVKKQLFIAFFSNILYMCALWVNYSKQVFHTFTIAYNEYRILNNLECLSRRIYISLCK